MHGNPDVYQSQSKLYRNHGTPVTKGNTCDRVTYTLTNPAHHICREFTQCKHLFLYLAATEGIKRSPRGTKAVNTKLHISQREQSFIRKRKHKCILVGAKCYLYIGTYFRQSLTPLIILTVYVLYTYMLRLR